MVKTKLNLGTGITISIEDTNPAVLSEEALYLKECNDFNKIIKKAKERGQEVYFGIDNPLRTGLINQLTIMRELFTKEKETNPSIKNTELIAKFKKETEALGRIIEESFNIEKCAIGYENQENAACFSQVYNKELAGKDEKARKKRIQMDDIVEYKNGFKYKNKKGIYYALSLGLPFLLNKERTSIPEVAAIIVHECGHGMQHVVNSINANLAISYWNSIMDITSSCYGDIPNKIIKTLKKIEEGYLSHDTKNLDKIGGELLDEFDPKNMADFSELTPEEITAISNDDIPIDSESPKPKKKRNIFIRSFFGIFKAAIGVIFSIFLIPMILVLKSKLQDKQNSIYKHNEMTADSFANYYGLGPELASYTSKSYLERAPRGDTGIFNYVPLFDLWHCHAVLKKEYILLLCGYPSNKQRIINVYVACDFELKNNKDLSESAKSELKEQMNSLKETYDNFVANESRGGFLYTIAKKCGNEELEKAAERDASLRENILEPLKKKQDTGIFKK